MGIAKELPFLCWQCYAHGYSQGISWWLYIVGNHVTLQFLPILVPLHRCAFSHHLGTHPHVYQNTISSTWQHPHIGGDIGLGFDHLLGFYYSAIMPSSTLQCNEVHDSIYMCIYWLYLFVLHQGIGTRGWKVIIVLKNNNSNAQNRLSLKIKIKITTQCWK